jgi:hypothetical protein
MLHFFNLTQLYFRYSVNNLVKTGVLVDQLNRTAFLPYATENNEFFFFHALYFFEDHTQVRTVLPSLDPDDPDSCEPRIVVRKEPTTHDRKHQI